MSIYVRHGRENSSHLPNPMDHVRKGDFAVRDGHSHAECTQKQNVYLSMYSTREGNIGCCYIYVPYNFILSKWA